MPLNPKLTIRENIALLYKKAKKSERGGEVNAKKVAATEEEIITCKKLVLLCETAIAEQDAGPANDLIGLIEVALAGHLPQGAQSLSTSTRHEEKIPYRHFSIDGWDVYVGKNDRQNDELTTRFAKSNDLWLHVAGHAGSHLVIRRPERNAQVPQEVVNKVASLAVWFSKQSTPHTRRSM